ncbi:hypothetical protein OMW55_10160 [Sphingomonas sp. BN140010]|uniref:Uncharacterized protein n=1 Tax=Sphingomonas arvum TaxID=2992113 RepID=A0ABT3JGF9_9SPHN|nr:hypothetical protein [Sphingomonas sp. BN140010]MCW3798167.1 hypothetical protein [Sphingomonas sp. BN140010]
MSDLLVDRKTSAELTGSEAALLLRAAPGGPDREALVRFLAGRDERPAQGAFASLAPAAQKSKE